MVGLLYILASVAGFAVIMTVIYQIRLSRHKGVPRDVFIGEFRSLEIPDAIPAAVYDYYRSSAISKRFSVLPQDRFDDLFSAEAEDLTDDATELVSKLGMQMPIEPVLREWKEPMTTLADMVRWLNWVRRHQG